jgi:hypothetical protein
MKKNLIAIVLLVFVLSAFAVSADLTVSEVKLGGASQERDVSTPTVTVTVKNTGVAAVTGLNVVKSPSTGYTMTVSALGANLLQPNESTTFTVQATLALSHDAVDTKGIPAFFSIGSLTIESNEQADKVATVYAQAENNLEFGKSRIKYTNIDNNDKDKSLGNNDDFDEVKRDQEVTLEVEVKNKFDNDGNCDERDDYGDCAIEDVELDFEPKNSDFDDDSFDMGDINSDDEDTETFSFEVPDDVDEDDYDFEMWVTGDDENGARHGEYMVFTLNVEVPRDQITISDAYLNPASVSCDATRTTLKVEVENTGTRDQDEVVIEVESSALSIKMLSYPPYLDLEEGDTQTKNFDLKLPSNVEPGTYNIIITSNFDGNEESDTESVSLTVRECVTDVPDSNDNDDNIDWGNDDKDNTVVQVIEVPPSTGVIYGNEKETEKFSDSPQYIFMLVGLFIVALLVFFVLIALLLRK